MSRSVRINLIIVGIILAVVAAPFLVPLDMYRTSLERAASTALAREVHIRGPIHLSVYPSFGLALSDVSVANPKGASDKEMVKAERLIVGAKPVPLLTGGLEVTELTFEKPVVHLEVGEDGSANWVFGAKPAEGANRAADARALNRLGFSHMNIVEGSVSYFDAGSGRKAQFQDVSVSLDMPNAATLARPLNFNGSLVYNKEKLSLNGRLDNFWNSVSPRGTASRLSIGSRIINAEFTGTVGTDGFSGAIKLGARSIRNFANWVGSPLPAGNGLGLVALEGQFTARSGVYTLKHTHLAFDSMNMDAELEVDTNPDVPRLKGHGTINRLDTNPYLAPGQASDVVTAGKVRAANPEAPLSLGGLKAVNADMIFAFGELVLPALTVEKAIVKAKLDDGLLTIDLDKITANGSTGTGRLIVDTRGETPEFSQTLELNDFNAQPFFTQALGVNAISGQGAARFELNSHGLTGKAIRANLRGKGEIRIADGALAGADLGGVARAVKTASAGNLPATVAGANAKTPFAKLAASFEIVEGVVRSESIQLGGPAAQLSGRGSIDLAEESMDFRFMPAPADSAQAAPFSVTGPWSKPSFAADAGGMGKTAANPVPSGATASLEHLTQAGALRRSAPAPAGRPR